MAVFGCGQLLCTAVFYESLCPDCIASGGRDKIMEKSAADGKINVPADITLNELLEVIGEVVKEEKMPTPKKLCENAGEPVVQTKCGDCKVYANGYAVYCNSVGRAVLWLADCFSFTYHFARLEGKEYMPDTDTLDGDFLGSLPWFIGVMIRGDHQVERNSMNRQFDRRGSKKELWDGDGAEETGEMHRNFGYCYESPESACIRRETMEEQLGRLTDKQREVFILYHGYGYKQHEIAEMLGITQKAVDFRLNGAESKVRVPGSCF